MIIKEKDSIKVIEKTAIRKWGNSQGIRLSKEVMKSMGLEENDQVEISIYNGQMVITKISKPQYRSLKERLEAFYNRPIDKIYVEGSTEINSGEPVGGEIW